jgi:hypothetical protein
MLIEPTQTVKIFLNNVRFHINFTSNFAMSEKNLINYSEETDVRMTFGSINGITMFLKFEVAPKTKRLKATLERIIMVADHNSM